MDDRIPFPFPEGCEVVGAVNIAPPVKGAKATKFYVKGVHEELRCFGAVAFIPKGLGEDGTRQFETEVTVVRGFPPEVFLG